MSLLMIEESSAQRRKRGETTTEAPKAAESDLAKDGSTEINVKNADIAAIIRIFSKKTKRNYILDERVKGKVSIYLPGKVSSKEAIRILDAVLSFKGFTAVPIGDNLWKIVTAREAQQTTIPTIESTKGRGSPSFVTRLVNLRFVAAADLQKLLSPLVSSNGLFNAYTGTNSILMIDSEENIQRVMKLIKSLDVPFTDQELTIIPITHADAVDIAAKINEIMGTPEEQRGATAAQQRAAATSRSTSSSRTDKGRTPSSVLTTTVLARSKQPKIISDERTNSLIVVADDDTTARIRALVSQLDSDYDLSGARLYVYRCQHASAEDLADVFSSLVEGGSRTSSRTSSRGTNQDRRVQRSVDRLAQQRRTPGQSRTTSTTRGAITSANFGEDVSLTADPATNSLIIKAGREDYARILELLRELDIKRRQVLVEAMILEVGIDDTLSVSTEFLSSGGGADGGVFASNTTGDLATLFSNPTQLTNFTLAAASSGTLTLPGGVTIPTQSVLLRAAHNSQNVNVLSAPTILATDNQQAEIIVGQNVPFFSKHCFNPGKSKQHL